MLALFFLFLFLFFCFFVELYKATLRHWCICRAVTPEFKNMKTRIYDLQSCFLCITIWGCKRAPWSLTRPWIFLPRFHGFLHILSRGHETLHLAVSVGPSVRLSVRWSHFWIVSGFRITAPAQSSATGLPCIRPCSSRLGFNPTDEKWKVLGNDFSFKCSLCAHSTT